MQELSRRSFLKIAALLGAGSLLVKNLFWDLIENSPNRAFAAMEKPDPITPKSDPIVAEPDLVSVKGQDLFSNTTKAVEELGGMKTFVSRGDRVGLLVNSPFRNLGTSVHPDITLAVIQMCYDAGAKEIHYLKDPHKSYWEKTSLAVKYALEIKSLRYESGDHVKVDIPRGVSLKDAKVNKEFLKCDAFINISKTKHHRGVHMSGTLKNMMGLCPFSTNIMFHLGDLSLKNIGLYGNIEHLSQCIADLNLIRKPELCISDASVFITEKGPYGPGKLGRADMVAASPNRVILDAFCSRLLGHKPEKILMIRNAFRHGLGEIDLQKVRIKQLAG
jgi:uncharacterized protein (DUF362 family)